MVTNRLLLPYVWVRESGGKGGKVVILLSSPVIIEIGIKLGNVKRNGEGMVTNRVLLPDYWVRE